MPSALLSFSALLRSRVDGSLPYADLKHLLRCLRRTHPKYPHARRSAQGVVASLSQSCAYTPRHTQSPVCASGRRGLGELSVSKSSLKRRQRSSKRPILQIPSPPLFTLPEEEEEERHERRGKMEEMKKEGDEKAGDLLRDFSGAGTADAAADAAADPTMHIVAFVESSLTPDNPSVSWQQLCEMLQKASPSYTPFCNSLHTVFSSTDAIATLHDQHTPCVYYSDVFWHSAWKEYLQCHGEPPMPQNHSPMSSSSI